MHSSTVSSGHRSGTPSPTLSPKDLSSRNLSFSSLSPPISPVIKAVASSVVMVPPINVAVQPQQQSNHVRSNSLPSLQHYSSRAVELPATPVNLVRDSLHSASAANLMAQRRESIITSQACGTHFPKSPRLRPLMSPGPVTPMQLEEDLEYRFHIVPTPIRHSPLVVPLTLGMEEPETEECLEMLQRSR